MNSRFTEKAEKVLNAAMLLAEEFGHTYIGTEHLLLAIATEEGTYSAVILAKHKISEEMIKKSIKDYSGSGTPGLLTSHDTTPRCRRVIESAYRIAEKHHSEKIGTEHLLYSLLEERDSVAGRLIERSGSNITAIKDDVLGYIRLTEREMIRRDTAAELNIPNLTKYGRNMTKLAKEGAFDPVIGRDRETDRVIRILSRKRKNNPCLLGEAGVGKTAIVEGLATRISQGNVPNQMLGKLIFSVDLSSMVAGAKYRGDFEERIKSIMDEAAKNKSVILFIDEIHSIVGAGSAEGAIDASNIMKPELARGDIQLIGATTISEYRKYIEKDAALERRFQPIMIEEPKKEEALLILRGIKEKYEEHHKTKIEDSALIAALDLSCRYFPDRHLPDKAIDLIDEACAMVSTDRNIKNILDISGQNKRASKIVTDETIKDVLGEILGNELKEKDKYSFSTLESRLSKKVIGQNTAVSALTSAIKRSSVGLFPPSRPRGIFLFIGETGVGKTELAHSLAIDLYGKEDALIRYDMSEFSEPNSISKFIGSAPGYVGYDETIQSLEKIRKHPHSVVLFDEIEKAHPDVLALFLQIFDNGFITDSSGRKINFRNTYIIMTSNVGCDGNSSGAQIGFAKGHSKNNLYNKLKSKFKPEFINRIDEIIEFSALDISALEEIAKAKLEELAARAELCGLNVKTDESVANAIAKEAYSENLGARPVFRIISAEIETKIASLILEEGSFGTSVHITHSDDGYKFEKIDFAILGEG